MSLVVVALVAVSGAAVSRVRAVLVAAQGSGAGHRTRTDVPREVTPGPAVRVPGHPAATPAARDLSAARDVVWPLPAQCSSRTATGSAPHLPEGTGYSTDPASLGAGARLRRVLAVHDDRIEPVDGAGPVTRCDELRWAVLRAAIPARHRAYLDQVVLYDYPAGTGASAIRTGFFEPDPADPTRYRIAMAVDLSDLEQLLTIAHEVGHVVSLYPDRPHPAHDATCPWIIDDAGTCASSTSPMGDFYARTYPAGTRSLVSRLYADHRSPSKDELRSVYAAHPYDFVSGYAATHPTEDFAESYAYWCLWGTSTSAPVDGGGAHGLAKRAFFDDEVRRGRLDAPGCTVLRGIVARG